MIWIVLALIALALIVVFLILSQKSATLSHEFSYQKLDALFSQAKGSSPFSAHNFNIISTMNSAILHKMTYSNPSNPRII